MKSTETISPADFVREVTNPWFPLRPGSVWHYKGLKEAPVPPDDFIGVATDLLVAYGGG